MKKEDLMRMRPKELRDELAVVNEAIEQVDCYGLYDLLLRNALEIELDERSKCYGKRGYAVTYKPPLLGRGFRVRVESSKHNAIVLANKLIQDAPIGAETRAYSHNKLSTIGGGWDFDYPYGLFVVQRFVKEKQ